MKVKDKFVSITDLLETIVDNRGKSVPTEEVGFPLIATNCIKHSSIYPTFDKIRYVSQRTFDNWFRAHLKSNDILFVNKGTPGRVCLVPNPVTFCAAQDMMGFRVDENKIYYKYLFAVLRSDWIQKKISNYHVGLVIPHFKKQDLKSILIPLKSKVEQKAIGDIYVGISEKIEINNKINKELEAMAKTLYDYWFVQFDFPMSKEYARSINKPELTGKPYKASGGKMVFNKELKREIPEGWKDGTFDNVAQIIGGSTPSKAIDLNFTTNGGTSWITPKDLSLNKGKKYISKGEINVTQSGLKSASLKVLPAGSVLLSSRAPIGYLAIAREPVTTNQGFKSFVPKKYFTTEYLYYQIKNKIPLIEARSSGSTFKEVSGSILKSIKVLTPPEEIIELYQNTIGPVFEKQNILEQENQKLAELRDWLLPMLMNGQVRVEKGYEEVEEELGMVAENNGKYEEG